MSPITSEDNAKPRCSWGDGVAALDSLTEPQLEILRLVSNYHTNREIADELTIAESTVESHVHHILQKLRVRTRHGAARLYRDSLVNAEGSRNRPIGR